jgi:ribosomal protein L30E
VNFYDQNRFGTRHDQECSEDRQACNRIETTKNALKNGRIEYVFIASNAPQNIIEELEHNAAITEAKVSQIRSNAEDLGVACKKQFRVSVVGVLRK